MNTTRTVANRFMFGSVILLQSPGKSKKCLCDCTASVTIDRNMKWRIRVVTKRKRKQAMRIKGNSIDELTEKLAKHSSKFLDFEIETPVNDPAYWKSLILK